MAQLNLTTRKSFSDNNMKRIINILVGLMSSVSALEDQCIKEYDETKTYQKGQIVVGSDGYFYEAVTVTNGVFDSSKWTKIGTDSFTELSKEEVENLLNLTPEQITTLSSIILDSEVRLDKGWSSSKIFMSIQDAIDTSKAYTLAELGKMSGASYKVVTSTSEMTSESIIYLLASGNTYDMYIVEENGTARRIGDTTINLDNYFTKAEIEADYLKKTDADGKYATIDTVDNHISDSDIHITQEDKLKLHLIDIKNSSILFKKQNDDLEGGEITLEKPTNSTLNADIGIDLFKNTLRIYENGGSYRGLQIDLSKLANNFNSKLCTTSVADVPRTFMSLPDGNTGELSYMVKNGFATITIFNLAIATSPLVVTGLPIPATYVANPIVGADGMSVSGSICYSDNDKFVVYGTPGIGMYGVVTYPVAE